jgi:nuclear transport factor 2 (NTF2) superfamily protein
MLLSPPTILWHGPQERRIEADAKNFPESRFKADPDKNYSLPELIDLIKELWAYGGNRIAVRFAYEWHDDSGNWFRLYGNENWEFDENGLMRMRFASINDLPITDTQRKYHWALGRRPDDHPGLSDLGF